jgi:NTE family protein
LHFDDLKGIGLLLNYTGRNILGNSSRILLSIDITNDFSYRAQYQNNFGKTKNFWFRSELFGEKIDQRRYVEGKYGTDLQSHHLQFENQINLNINSFKNYIGLGISGDWNHIEPKIDPNIHENIYYLKNYSFNTIDIYLHYEHNTLDQIFYAKKGTYFRTKLSTSLKNDMMVEYSDNSVKPEAIGSVNPFTKIRYNFEKRIPINNNLSTILGISAGYSFYNEHNNELDFSYYGYAAHYFLGGNIVRPRLDTFVTNGLNENELAATQFSMLNIAFQYTPLSKIYLKPHATIASVGFGKFNNYLSDFLQPTGNWINFNKTSLLTTIGFTASYSSIIGPVDLDISWTNKIRKPRYYLGIGYHFNP